MTKSSLESDKSFDPRPHRVLYVETPSARYGSSISLFELVRSLDRSKVEPLVAVNERNAILHDFAKAGIPTIPISCDEPPAVGLARGSQRLSEDRLRIGRRLGIWLRRLRDRVHFRAVIRKLNKEIIFKDIDILHLNNQPSTNRFGYFLRKKGVKIVQHVRGAPMSKSSYAQSLTKKTDAFVCISEFVREDVERCYGSVPTFVVPNPLPADWSASPGAESLREKLGIGPDDVVFGQVGRLIRRKGQDIFLSAFADALEGLGSRAGNAHCLLFGTSVYGDEFEAELRELAVCRKIENRVRFLGYMSDLQAGFLAMDVLVQYDREPEGFGRVVAEAMYCGVPALVSNRGALPELISDGVNGFIANSEDQLRQMIEFIVKAPETVRSLKQACRDHAEQFRASRCASEIEQIYHSLA